MTKSVWDRLAEMPAEKRESYLKTAPLRAKTTQSGPKGAIYSTVEIVTPNGDLIWRGGPEWDAD